MNTIISKTRQLIFTQQTNLISSTVTLSLMIVLASFFGFIRLRLMTNYFTTDQLDIFLSAFRIPDLVFEILITGALTTTFIPFFLQYDHNKEEQSKYISSIMNGITVILIIAVAIFFFILPYAKGIISPGYSAEKYAMVVAFSRLLLIGQLPFLVFGNFLTGMSQARKSFFLPAITPVIYNISIILSLLLFAPAFSLYAPIIGVMSGAFLFFLIQIPIIRVAGFHYRLIFQWSIPVKNFIFVIIPRVCTVIVSQIDMTIDLTLSTLISSGSYTIFYYAQRLQLLPVSIIGVAMGQASLPYLTDLFQQDKKDEFKSLITGSILNMFFFMIPIASFIIFARTPLVRLFVGGNKFDWDATVQTAITLSYFALSLPFHTIYYFITRCFYAIVDSKTPFIVGGVSVLMNTLGSIFCIQVLHLPVWVLGLTFSASITINVIVLFFLLSKKIQGIPIEPLIVETAKIVLSTIIASLFSYTFLKIGDTLIFDTSRTFNLAVLIALSGIIFLSLYAFCVWIFDISEITILTKVIFRIKHLQKRLLELPAGTQTQ